MRKLLGSIILMLMFFHTNGQMVIDGGLKRVLLETKPASTLSEIVGSPYLEEIFQPGEIQIEGKNNLQVYLRYNVDDEVMEIKTSIDDSKIYQMSPAIETRYKIGQVTFDQKQLWSEGEKYTGYFINHFEGTKYALLEKPVIEIKEAKQARSGYEEDQPARMKIESKYFLQIDDQPVQNIRIRHRDFKKTFSSNVAREYLKKNRINSVDDVVNFLKHLEKE